MLTVLLILLAAGAVYCYRSSQRKHTAVEAHSRRKAQLLNQLSIRQNDLEHHQRWLKKFNTDDDAALHLIHSQAVEALQRDIAALKQALADLDK